MSKFAMISLSKNYDSKELKSFKKKSTAKYLKKQLKCNEVVDLLENYNEETLKKITEIDETKLDDVISAIDDFDIANLKLNNLYSKNKYKIFAFSEDAQSTSFVFDKLKEDVQITLFELDEESADVLIENIENIKSCNESIDTLTDARDTLEALNELENELNLRMTYSDAEDEIDSMSNVLEEEINNSRDEISTLLSWS